MWARFAGRHCLAVGVYTALLVASVNYGLTYSMVLSEIKPRHTTRRRNTIQLEHRALRRARPRRSRWTVHPGTSRARLTFKFSGFSFSSLRKNTDISLSARLAAILCTYYILPQVVRHLTLRTRIGRCFCLPPQRDGRRSGALSRRRRSLQSVRRLRRRRRRQRAARSAAHPHRGRASSPAR